VNEETKQLLEEVKAGVTADVFEKLKAEISLRKDIFGGANNTDAQKAEAKEKCANFVKAVFNRDLASIKALSEGTTTDGGYVVPEYFASEIIRVAGQYGIARKGARNWPVSGYKTNVPTISNVVAYRVGEKSAITASQPTFSRTTLTLKKIASLIPMSNELLKDANINVIDQLVNLSAEAFAKYEDEWAFLGKAGGEGIFQSTTAPVYTMASGSDAFADVTFDDLLEVMNKLDEGALSGAKWYMSFSIFNQLRKLKYASGTASYILQEPAGGMPATIWNIPVEFVSVMPKTSLESQAGQKFIALANLSYMLFGDARQYEVTISQEATITDTDGQTQVNLFEQDMSAVRVIERVDIQLAEASKAFAVCKTATS